MNLVLTGFKELDAVFKALPRSMDHKTWSAINYERSKPLVRQMKANAPVGATHNLVNSIGSVKLSAKRTDLGAVRSGARRNRGYKGFAAGFNELGTKQRRTKRGANRGKMTANPFLERSFRQVAPQMERGTEESARKVLVRTAKRFLK